VAALLNALGRPRLALWSRATASSANYPEPRIMPRLKAAGTAGAGVWSA
jgi:hypothetical protein